MGKEFVLQHYQKGIFSDNGGKCNTFFLKHATKYFSEKEAELAREYYGLFDYEILDTSLVQEIFQPLYDSAEI